MTTETIHLCPSDNSGICPCCGRTPFELGHDDRMTTDPAQVTCKAKPTPPPERPPGDFEQAKAMEDNLHPSQKCPVCKTDPCCGLPACP